MEWDKANNTISKGFDIEPFNNEKYLITRIKSYEKKKKSTKFHGDKILKDGSQCICLLVLLINSVFRTGKNYYYQAFSEEC